MGNRSFKVNVDGRKTEERNYIRSFVLLPLQHPNILINCCSAQIAPCLNCGEKPILPTEPERKNAEFLGWFTDADGGTQVTNNTIFNTDSDTTYYAHWEITEIFSVTVPVTLPLIVDESGEVHTGEASIINTSTGTVQVSNVSISAKNGWTLVPFDTDMAHEKVDAKLLGFQINDAETKKNGSSETFTLSAPWTIAENSKLPLSYDAVVSAVSQAVTEQDVLSIVFVLEWA